MPKKQWIKQRKCKIIWINPPYSEPVKINIGSIFIKLIGKHFLPNHKFIKTFKKNITKLSSSCMQNIRSKINGHKKKILHSKPTEPQKSCNYLFKEDFPMNELCVTSSILYQATIKCNDNNKSKKDTKESAKRTSRNVTQTTKIIQLNQA